MSKVLTFSRTFPAYHPKKGEPTYFVEKIAKARHFIGLKPCDIPDEIFSTEMYHIIEPKYHTIRAGHRFKVGDYFSPRVWSDKPYRSKQIVIAPDIKVVKTWDFETINGKFILNGVEINAGKLIEIATNDGLSAVDFMDWFNKPFFSGQVTAWNESINY